MVFARTDSSLSEWRRRETVKQPRENARSGSVDDAVDVSDTSLAT